MEAAATPFPREETTPPVTKMYFGAVRKSGEILRDNLRTKHYAGIWGECQIANFFGGINFLGSGGDRKDLTQRGRRKGGEHRKRLKREASITAEKQRARRKTVRRKF